MEENNPPKIVEEKKPFPLKKFLAVTVGGGLIGCLIVALMLGALFSYPNNLMFASKWRWSNRYYDVTLTSFICDLWLQDNEVTAFYNIFQLEENFEGDWELENLWKREVADPYNGTFTLVYTESTLPTQEIVKYWMFYPDRPYFKLRLVRTYIVEGENCNNQIIVDVKNHQVHSNVGDREPITNLTESPWVCFDLWDQGVFGFVVVEADPLNFTISMPHHEAMTEVQINFHDQGNRDLRYHYNGETEVLELLVYADSGSTLEDFKEWVNSR